MNLKRRSNTLFRLFLHLNILSDLLLSSEDLALYLDFSVLNNPTDCT